MSEEGNNIIAMFMGLIPAKAFITTDAGIRIPSERKAYFHNGTVYTDNELEYSYNYEWTMPVLFKIESLGYKWEIGISSTSLYHYCRIWPIGSFEGVDAIDAIYAAVIEFIKWYNKTR